MKRVVRHSRDRAAVRQCTCLGSADDLRRPPRRTGRLRHGDRADDGRRIRTLSEAGKARAQSLAAALKDARITAIFTTAFKRTQQTAEPLAKALGIQLTVVPAPMTCRR